jgi:hypothetical protein
MRDFGMTSQIPPISDAEAGDAMEEKHFQILRNLLTHAEPLGPVDQNRIENAEIASILLNHNVNPFRDVSTKTYMILYGRKGAGKSAMLIGPRLDSFQRVERDRPVLSDLPTEGSPIIIAVTSWAHFHKIARNVSTQFQEDDLLTDLIPPEYYSSLWYQMLWDEIIVHFYNYAYYAQEDLQPIIDFVNADSFFQGSAKEKAKQLFEAARNSILRFLKKRQSRLYFLFDSMEDYPVRNSVFSRVLGGLFQALSKINGESFNIEISFCIPEEIETFLSPSSANLLKDFSSSYRIRWRPIDLLRIVAHRFRLAMEIYDEEFHYEFSHLDFSERPDIHRLFKKILPSEVKNSLGCTEDPLAYIVRHTQLLPRHVLLSFNWILSRNFLSSGGFRQVSETAIREGVTQSQSIIADQILHLYQRLYPRLLSACREILPDLNPICSFSELKKVENRFKRRVEEDVISVWDTLFQMGVIGRATTDVSDRYCYAHFHFNKDRAFAMATDSEYCFHPVFSRAFGIRRRNPKDKRVVYPANVEMVTLYE